MTMELGIVKDLEEVEQTTSVYIPEQPEYSTYTAGTGSSRAYLYGTEYQTGGPDNGPLHSVHQHNVPCAVCYTSTRETVVHDLPAHHPGPRSTKDISWQSTTIIIVQCLNI